MVIFKEQKMLWGVGDDDGGALGDSEWGVSGGLKGLFDGVVVLGVGEWDMRWNGTDCRWGGVSGLREGGMLI